MRRFYAILISALATIGTIPLNAQKTRTYDVTSGLSANSIKGIIQDNNGYIWFATTDGLNVFNGKEFKSYGCSYKIENEDNINALNLLTVCLHKDGEKIWAGTQSSDIHLFDPEKETFQTLSLDNNNPGQQSPNLCYSLSYDTDGKLWIGTDNGLYIYEESKDELSCLTTANSNLTSNSIHYTFCDSNGTVWLGTTKGLLKYNSSTENFTRYGDSIHIITITEGDQGNLWVGTWNKGIGLLERQSNTLKTIHPSGDNEFADQMRVRSILHDKGNLYWVCTNYGLFRYDASLNRLSLVILSPDQPNDNIYSSLKDREGGIWIGTFFQGLHYLSPIARQLECYTPHNTGGKMNGYAISCFCEDLDGNIFIGSENGGLSLFDPSKQKLINTPVNLSANNIHALCIDNGKLYAGTYSQGLIITDIKTGRTRTFSTKIHKGMASNNIFSLYNGNDGLIYLGFDRGCATFDKKNGTIKAIDCLKGEFIYDIADDANGNLWFATYYNGVLKYNRGEDKWVRYIHQEDDPKSLPHNKTLYLYTDDNGQIWVCTEGGGLCRYDSQNDCFDIFRIIEDKNIVGISLINGIVNDSKGRLWISSNNGLWACRPDGTVMKHLTHEDGLQSNQHNPGSIFRSSTGKLYFGGVYGFNVINPENLKHNKTQPTVTARISYESADKTTHRSKTISDKGNVVIPRDVPSFVIDFECLSYTAPHKNTFAYKIDKASEWVYTNESSVSFVNFPYGDYTLEVKAKNGDGVWSQGTTAIIIQNLPPLHKSLMAKILYILIALGFIGGATIMIIRRHDERSKIKLNEAKIEFFTHVAHEIKTPVTLIKAPLDVTLRNIAESDDKHNLEIISKNTDRLLDLVNQLLDFKKINSEGHRVNIRPADPISLVKNVVERFDGNSLGNITITTDIADIPPCMLDAEAYTKIISNLMTNALKHAKTRIDVSLSIREGKLHLEVSDDGCGIPEDEQMRIFDSFYQVKTSENKRMSGVGIGLSLVKILVKKHNGKVYIDNRYKDGCRVCVDIPHIISDVPETEPEKTLSANTDPLIISPVNGTNLLIVEDTADMLDFISGVFKENYNIYKAENGKVALEILYRSDIDIIISDVSMPVMNGFELLQEVRKNDLFCHIPMIMLTVETAIENKIKGMEYGADAYLEKPFSPTHLMAVTDNLINRRNTLLISYIANPIKTKNESIQAPKDRNWFERLTDIINNNIHEPEISVESLAEELNMSRSSFQRKLKGLTGLSPVEFIRLIRLKKAAELLNSGRYRVNEVAYMVGFNKPSYFSAMFKKQFGTLPKDYKE